MTVLRQLVVEAGGDPRTPEGIAEILDKLPTTHPIVQEFDRLLAEARKATRETGFPAASDPYVVADDDDDNPF
jgi:hypothetical protein